MGNWKCWSGCFKLLILALTLHAALMQPYVPQVTAATFLLSLGCCRIMMNALMSESGRADKRHLPSALAASEGHVDVMQALLHDPRVDAEAFVRSYLKSERKQLSSMARHILLRKPSVVRLLTAEPAVGGAAERFPLPASFGRSDVRGWAAAAWRRRRGAVLAWVGQFL